MHILTNEGLRKAEQVEVQCILANLHNDLEHSLHKYEPTTDEKPVEKGIAWGLCMAQSEILDILQAYDDPDFIRDFFDGQDN